MSLSTDTTKGNIILTLLTFYVYSFCKLYYCCCLETRTLIKQNSYFNLDTKLQKWWIRGDKRVLYY